MRTGFFCAALIVLFDAAACGNDGMNNMPGGDGGTPVKTVQSIAITPEMPTIARDSTQPFTLAVKFTDNSTMAINGGVTWSVSDVANQGTGVATISAAGLARGTAQGQALITALYMGKTATTHLQVTAPVTVDFDTLASNIAVTDQYKQYVTFSSDAGFDNVSLGYGSTFNSSPPNIMCGSNTCTHSTNLDFAKPVSLLKFKAVGVNNTGKVADINVFVGGQKMTTVDLIGVGLQNTPVVVDLSSFTNVTRIEITNVTDNAGIGTDDYSFVTF